MARFFRKNYGRHLPKDRAARILDLGCGPGHFLYYLQKDGYTDYLGIDSSPECLEFCRERGLNAGLADAFVHLAENAGRYDAVVCNEFFEHLPKDRAFELARLCRLALSDGGVLLIKVPNMACPVAATRSRYEDITHETGYVDESLRTMLEVSGFGEVDVLAPDIYVSRHSTVNFAARMACRLTTAWYSRPLPPLRHSRAPRDDQEPAGRCPQGTDRRRGVSAAMGKLLIIGLDGADHEYVRARLDAGGCPCSAASPARDPSACCAPPCRP